jgi:hypothetical protein
LRPHSLLNDCPHEEPRQRRDLRLFPPEKSNMPVLQGSGTPVHPAQGIAFIFHQCFNRIKPSDCSLLSGGLSYSHRNVRSLVRGIDHEKHRKAFNITPAQPLRLVSSRGWTVAVVVPIAVNVHNEGCRPRNRRSPRPGAISSARPSIATGVRPTGRCMSPWARGSCPIPTWPTPRKGT